MTQVSEPALFYDALAPYYDLIFEDWGASMQRQGAAIATLLRRFLPAAVVPLRVLDATAGIGTQSLPLAELGFEVASRDVSSSAIARLAREAAQRGLTIDTAQADMRTVATTISEPFDAVVSFDNSVSHLQTDEDILSAFRSFHSCLRSGGVCLLSVRDYDRVERGKDLVQAYGVRWREGTRYLPLQAWHWVSATHCDVTFYIIVEEQSARLFQVTTRNYAISTSRLLELLGQAGFAKCERLDETIYQPIIAASRT